MLVVFTDLDGTLLEAGNGSHQAARPALRRLARLRVPLVFCSSKTRAELLFWRRRLRNRHPFVSENGGGVFIPAGYFPGRDRRPRADGLAALPLGVPYARLRREFSALRQRLGADARGFGDMSVSEVAALTGLTRHQARLALQRDFSEPFLFACGEDRRFLRAIEATGRSWTRGELYHLMAGHDKGRAVSLLLARYRRLGPVLSAALGDGLNDLPMLRVVERPFLVRRPGGFAPGVDFPGLARTRGVGPAGWNEALLALLDELGPAAAPGRDWPHP